MQITAAAVSENQMARRFDRAHSLNLTRTERSPLHLRRRGIYLSTNPRGPMTDLLMGLRAIMQMASREPLSPREVKGNCGLSDRTCLPGIAGVRLRSEANGKAGNTRISQLLDYVHMYNQWYHVVKESGISKCYNSRNLPPPSAPLLPLIC